MQAELIFTIGAAISALSIPSALAALTDSRPPWVAVLVFGLGGALVLYAVTQLSPPFTWTGVPEVIYTGIAQALR